MPKQNSKPVYVTPVGEAVYPWLNKPDARSFKGEPPKPQWKVNIRYLANDPAWLEFKAKIDEMMDARYTVAVALNPKKKASITKLYPYSLDTDDQGDENGYVTLKLKQNAVIVSKKDGAVTNIDIPLYGPDNHPINRETTPIYGGSMLQASFTVRTDKEDKLPGYYMPATGRVGLNLDLKAVKVKSLVTAAGGRSAESFGFGGAEDEEMEEEGVASASESDASDPTDF